MSDTLFLAVSYLDRYLSTHRVMRSRLQLVGVTCLLLAAKYEEIYAPNIEEFCYITDNTYSRKDVRHTPFWCPNVDSLTISAHSRHERDSLPAIDWNNRSCNI